MQSRFNMLNRSLEAEIQPMCAEHRLGIVPWGVLAEGFLTGKHTKEATAATKRQVDGHFADPKNWSILDEVRTIAAECKRTPAQVALAWQMARPGITAGHRGVAWHCTFRDPARTLREAEVREALTRGLAALEDELGVRRREG